MIVLDTNVVSELMRPRPDEAVVRWVDDQPDGQVAITAVTAAELLYGAARLPAGLRQRTLVERVVGMLRDDFADRILPFDADAAERYALVVVERERRGRPISAADAQIAAICSSHGAVLATRNGRDFDGIDVTVVDPWHSTS